ncbi:photosystem II protein PsbQ [Calothrix sp. UHCC 0171]|uniref:photosystem II protein PsbQ n=1 Tax=Calothrix sp. UHCC 0171 TaxID=3110245 RepID=UPI002B20834D|nr:photosystem II protein PsbQ [Calothrix sp. UHCC 0171]MEA5573778.1 photosystem II protein PsbQ [Calothrix sp. UHCC 0171]
MARQRTLISLILVFLATFLMSCGGPAISTPPPTYTQAQVQKINEYKTDIVTVRERAAELGQLIGKKEWIKVGNFIHGPMAEARLDMTYIIPNLLPNDQPAARKIARDLFDHLVKIDQAATSGNQVVAASNFAAAYSDFDKFLQLLPESSSSAEEG